MEEDFMRDMTKFVLHLKYRKSYFRDQLIPEETRDLVDQFRLALLALRNSPEGENRWEALMLLIDIAGWLASKGQYGYVDSINEFVIPVIGWEKVSELLTNKIAELEKRLDTLIRTPNSDEDKAQKMNLLHAEISHYASYLFSSDTFPMEPLGKRIFPTMQSLARYIAIKNGDDLADIDPDFDEE